MQSRVHAGRLTGDLLSPGKRVVAQIRQQQERGHKLNMHKNTPWQIQRHMVNV